MPLSESSAPISTRTVHDCGDVSTAREGESLRMNFIWYDPWLTCTLAVEDQMILLTFPIKPSVNNNQDIPISIEEIQRNSALVRRLVNSFHCTISQRIHRDALCSCALYSSRNSLLREIICRSNQGTIKYRANAQKC